MQVVVTGMHRSGTSMVTKLLAIAGCHVGDDSDLMEARPDNPEGFWEHRDAYRINESILESCGVRWDTLMGDEIAGIDPRERARHLRDIGDFVHSMTAHEPWVVKDPRFALTLPLWRPSLRRPVVVHCLRNPLDVALSLQGRNGFPLNLGLALWESYNLGVLRQSRGLPRVAVSYDDVMADPERTVDNLIQAVGVALGMSLHGLDAEQLSSTVKPSLHRSRSDADLESEFLTDRRRELERLITASSPNSASVLPELSGLSLDEILRHRERVRADASADRPDEEAHVRMAKAIERSVTPIVEAVGRIEGSVTEWAAAAAGRDEERRERDGDLQDGLASVVGAVDEVARRLTDGDHRVVLAIDRIRSLEAEVAGLRSERSYLEQELQRHQEVLQRIWSSRAGRVLSWWWGRRTAD